MFPPNAAPPPAGGAQPPMAAPGGAPMPPPQQSQGPSGVDQILLQRFQSLSEPEQDALDSVTPEAAAAILKLVPELKSIMQMVMEDQGGEDGEADAPEPSYGAEGEDGGPPMIPQKPRTQLGRM